jgi:hypothetical protein
MIQSRVRHLQNGADGKLFDRRPSYCAAVLRKTRPVSSKNLGSKNSKMVELRSNEFFTCDRIAVHHTYPFVVTSFGDRRTTNDFSGGVRQSHGANRTTLLGMAYPQNSPTGIHNVE